VKISFWAVDLKFIVCNLLCFISITFTASKGRIFRIDFCLVAFPSVCAVQDICLVHLAAYLQFSTSISVSPARIHFKERGIIFYNK